jgi:hypothetical protein
MINPASRNECGVYVFSLLIDSSYFYINIMINIDTDIPKQSRAYALLFIAENMLRVSMHNVMVSKVGIDYFREDVFPEYEYVESFGPKRTINIFKTASEKKALESSLNKSLGYTYPHLWYVDFRVLLSMLDIFGYTFFDPIFINKKAKHELLNRLKYIERARNSLAHNRFISNIDLADIESLHASLNHGLNTFYLFNFSELALNSADILLNLLSGTMQQLLNLIKTGKFVDRRILRLAESHFSAILSLDIPHQSIDDFNLIMKCITEFNKLPRKPGRSADISTFLSNTNLEDVISAFMTRLGAIK